MIKTIAEFFRERNLGLLEADWRCDGDDSKFMLLVPYENNVHKCVYLDMEDFVIENIDVENNGLLITIKSRDKSYLKPWIQSYSLGGGGTIIFKSMNDTIITNCITSTIDRKLAEALVDYLRYFHQESFQN